MMETRLPKEPPDNTDSGYQEPTDEPLVAEEDPIAYRTSFTRNVQSMETTLSEEPLDTTDIGSQVSVDKSLVTEEDPEETTPLAEDSSTAVGTSHAPTVEAVRHAILTGHPYLQRTVDELSASTRCSRP